MRSSADLPARTVPHLISFDIEGFIESSHDSYVVPQKYLSPHEETREIEENTAVILETLAECSVAATFFILGRIARDMPNLVRQIAAAGHEIAAHSFEHRRLHKFDRQESYEQLRLAKEYLEQASGQPVIGFRAPDFSIARDNVYVLDQLRELGYRYDSSVFPISFHDAYGLSTFPRVPFILPNGLIEFPMSTLEIAGGRFPFGGGGYLRLYPLWLTCCLLQAAARQGVPTVVYLHPVEMGNVVPYICELPLLRRVRTYVGIRGVRSKLIRLLRKFEFITFAGFLAQSPPLATIRVNHQGDQC